MSKVRFSSERSLLVSEGSPCFKELRKTRTLDQTCNKLISAGSSEGDEDWGGGGGGGGKPQLGSEGAVSPVQRALVAVREMKLPETPRIHSFLCP